MGVGTPAPELARSPAARAKTVTGRERPPGLARGRSPRALGLAIAIGVLFLLVVLSHAVGAKSMPVSTVLDAFFDYDPANGDHEIIRSARESRTIIGIMVGVALGLTGTLLQGLTRNPLGDPGILGLTMGAAFAAALAVTTLGLTGITGFVWFAFAGAAIAGGLVYVIGSLGRGGPTPVKLALAGAAVTALLTSATTLVLLLDLATLDALRFWLVGSLAGRSSSVAGALWPFVAAGAVMALLSGRLLNALSLGEDVARSLGQNVGVARLFAAIAVVLLSGAATAAAGPIAFVGLTIPHIARAITGPDYRWILPYSAVLAPILLLAADVVGRVVTRPAELQVGIVTAFIGAPVFVGLIRRRKLAEL